MIIFAIIQLFLFVVLFPVVVAAVAGLMDSINELGHSALFFLWGGGLYVLLCLFLNPLQGLYRFVQRIFADILRFSPFFSRNIPLFVPILPVLFLFILYILKSFGKPGALTDYIIFAVGFFLAMHLVLAAKDIFEEDASSFKAHYLFMMGCVVVVAVSLTVLLLDLNFKSIKIMDYLQGGIAKVQDIYRDAGDVVTFAKKNRH